MVQDAVVRLKGWRACRAFELAGLTLAWREAEAIAAIADNLLLPESVTAWLRRQKRQDS